MTKRKTPAPLRPSPTRSSGATAFVSTELGPGARWSSSSSSSSPRSAPPLRSPNAAVADGTHLCLLAPSVCSARGDDGTDRSDDASAVIPAIPMRLVREYLRRRRLRGGDFDDDGAESDDGDSIGTSPDSSSSASIRTAVPPVGSICLRRSDLPGVGRVVSDHPRFVCATPLLASGCYSEPPTPSPRAASIPVRVSLDASIREAVVAARSGFPRRRRGSDARDGKSYDYDESAGGGRDESGVSLDVRLPSPDGFGCDGDFFGRNWRGRPPDPGPDLFGGGDYPGYSGACPRGGERNYREVRGGGCVLVGDFVGDGGREQVLVLPGVAEAEGISDRSSTPPEDLLRILLWRSVLIDGTEQREGASDVVEMPPIILPRRGSRRADGGRGGDVCARGFVPSPERKIRRTRKDSPHCSDGDDDDDASGKPKQKRLRKSGGGEGGGGIEAPRASKGKSEPKSDGDGVDDGDGKEVAAGNKTTAPTPPWPWLEAIGRTVDRRTRGAGAAAARTWRTALIQGALVQRGRSVVRDALSSLAPAAGIVGDARGGARSDGTGGECSRDDGVVFVEPEIVRLRYGARPRRCPSAGSSSSPASVTLELEVDLRAGRERGGVGDRSNFGEDPRPALRDLHLSCSVVPEPWSRRRGDGSPRPPTAVVRTSSGIAAAALRSGECVTITATATLALSDVFPSPPHVGSGDGGLDAPCIVSLAIQALWTTDDGDGDVPDDLHGGSAARRRGSLLCVLRLPVEALCLSSRAVAEASAGCAGRWIEREIDFAPESAVAPPSARPGAVFEYRDSRNVVVDVSSSATSGRGGGGDVNAWRDLVRSLNERAVGEDGRVDLFWKEGDPALRIVVFASSPEERDATVRLVLRYLPDRSKASAAEVEIGDGATRPRLALVRALLTSLRSEADTVRAHRRLPPDRLAFACLLRLAGIQRSTDGVASKIKTGWV